MRAQIVSIVLGLLLLTWAAPALAGGFAVTTLDAVPADVQAGQTYRIGYTVRQHGVRPVRDARTSIRLEGPDGQKLSFAGLPEGAIGHYVAEVRVPAAGTWRWEVDQSPFPPQPLGTLEVRPGPAPSDAATPGATLSVLSLALPIAALGAGALFVGLAVVFARAGGRAAATDNCVPARPELIELTPARLRGNSNETRMILIDRANGLGGAGRGSSWSASAGADAGGAGTGRG